MKTSKTSSQPLAAGDWVVCESHFLSLPKGSVRQVVGIDRSADQVLVECCYPGGEPFVDGCHVRHLRRATPAEIDSHVNAELKAAGIDMAPAIERMHKMIDDHKAQRPGIPDGRTPIPPPSRYREPADPDCRSSSSLSSVLLTVVGFCVIAFALVFPLVSCAENYRLKKASEFESNIRQLGQRAKAMNVPATANPYIGQSAHYAQIWLDGWMNEAEKSQ